MASDTSPLRILHVAPYGPQAWAYGGIPRVVGALATATARLGHHVTLCTTDACDATSRLPLTATGAPVAGVDGVAWHIFPNLSNRLAYGAQCFTPIGLGRFLRDCAKQFDVAHLHACHNVPVATAARHLSAADVPYVVTPHGTAPFIERRRLAKRLFAMSIGRGLLTRASRVIAVSDSERRQLTTLGVAATRTTTVPSPIEAAEFATTIPRGRFRARHGLVRETVVAYLGTLSPRKRVPDLVSAFARLDGRPSLVVAGNDFGARAQIIDRLRATDVAARTLLTGLLRGRERLELLADADVVVYPSEHEIFGLVPLEALMAGTPVIVCGDSGCGEVVYRTGGGLVVPVGDVTALTEALRTVLATPERWRADAIAAGVRVKTWYADDVVARLTIQTYHDVLRETRQEVA